MAAKRMPSLQLLQTVMLLWALFFGLSSARMPAIGPLAAPSKFECDPPGTDECVLDLGKPGKLKLPVKLAFRTAHGSYLSITPPDGGLVSLKMHPYETEEWTMVRDGEKVAFKSMYGTYLTCKWDMSGYTLSHMLLADELFELDFGDHGLAAIRGNNGQYMSASPHIAEGVTQAGVGDEWEAWRIEEAPSGAFTLRSVHGHFLGASHPDTVGNVTHAYALDEWETFILDRAGPTSVTIETAHGTYLAAHANGYDVGVLPAMASYRASSWERWVPWVSLPPWPGAVCLQAKQSGFLWAMEELPTYDGFGLSDECSAHEFMEAIVVTEKDVQHRRASGSGSATGSLVG
mmetsp:Transcript_3962/g.7793  ORF Transcript_3962/g.7793 Transcript_3962/m.7793 type:complete len:346 (+) Transcript_3962:127-1164(+)|eukprot:CAMPEP_0173387474 /NCGR_PEP_ID=MMETSP1356-20130122/9970_1 /TAXON_ID=77927 ORGANISM="Hemiselmis virescens, Strain PCC157" /NCGR_SAMPLE_ID=MMETSP1356 /ASSEMBLY_ACC=CAM_ASM_000847 /LENGTH=345 /DNA_ID=CAMNT_0014344103 /DNA_START=119 /DNA_END=1156 /DNA_ORIENTATION=-